MLAEAAAIGCAAARGLPPYILPSSSVSWVPLRAGLAWRSCLAVAASSAKIKKSKFSDANAWVTVLSRQVEMGSLVSRTRSWRAVGSGLCPYQLPPGEHIPVAKHFL